MLECICECNIRIGTIEGLVLSIKKNKKEKDEIFFVNALFQSNRFKIITFSIDERAWKLITCVRVFILLYFLLIEIVLKFAEFESGMQRSLEKHS